MSAQMIISHRDSLQLTFDLFKQGISVSEIASRRNLAVSTIESHLRKLLEEGEVSIGELLDDERIDLIKNASEGKESLREIKDMLPSNVSYGEINYVLTELHRYKKREKERKSSIQSAINTYVGNYCYRKCFNHYNIIRDCEQKFELLAKELKGIPITFKEFNNMLKSGQIKICKLPTDKRRLYVSWKRFEYYKWKKIDYWDLENENTLPKKQFRF